MWLCVASEVHTCGGVRAVFKAAVLEQEAAIVEISLEQAAREVAGALDGGNGVFGLEEIDGAVGIEGVEDESDGEEYDENCMMEW